MDRALIIAVVAAFGSFLQGWDAATIAGVVFYIKREFHLQNEPATEGLIIVMPLIGAALITTCSGAIADWRGRRPMLISSSIFYLLGSLLMMWSPNLYILLLARLVEGLGVGLAVTLVPLYISEMASPETRGRLNTLPQFIGSCGMFIAYCIAFWMSMKHASNWRLMLGFLSIPSALYFFLAVCFLLESPRWLVSKAKMSEAKKVLQILHCRKNVSGEMALLVEGLGVGKETSLEKYIFGPLDDFADDTDISTEGDEIIKLYGPDQIISLAARPITGQNSLAVIPHQGSTGLTDPLVTLFSNIHQKFPEMGSNRSTLFPHLGSMFSVGGNPQRNEEEYDEESNVIEGDEYPSDSDFDDNLQSPLISRQATTTDKDVFQPGQSSSSSNFHVRHGTFAPEMEGEVEDTGIGGGWQLAWKWSDEEKGVDFRRIYLHQEGLLGSFRGTMASIPSGEPKVGPVKAVALVSRPALYSGDLVRHNEVGPAMVHPADVSVKGSSWRDLTEPGVKRALAIGVAVQLLQQFSGINGVLFYTPRILEHAGVGDLLSGIDITSESAVLLVSAITTLLMLPSIAIAVRLVDISGRRSLLLGTIPMLIASVIILLLSSLLTSGTTQQVFSTISIVFYICFFVMGFGPVPNILCSEIFPTRVRGICVALCGIAFWVGNVIVTYTLPVMLNSEGLAGTFGVYAAVCLVSWVFVFFKFPETKGMPLELVAEFVSLGAKR